MIFKLFVCFIGKPYSQKYVGTKTFHPYVTSEHGHKYVAQTASFICEGLPQSFRTWLERFAPIQAPKEHK